MAAHSSISPRESQGQRSLVGYSPQGHKESDTTEATDHAHISSFQNPQFYTHSSLLPQRCYLKRFCQQISIECLPWVMPCPIYWMKTEKVSPPIEFI